MRIAFYVLLGLGVGASSAAIAVFVFSPEMASKLERARFVTTFVVPFYVAALTATWSRMNAIEDRDYSRQRDAEFRREEREAQAKRDQEIAAIGLDAERREKTAKRIEALQEAAERYLSFAMLYGLTRVQHYSDQSDISKAARNSAQADFILSYNRLELLLPSDARDALYAHYQAMLQMPLSPHTTGREEQDRLMSNIGSAKSVLIDTVAAEIQRIGDGVARA